MAEAKQAATPVINVRAEINDSRHLLVTFEAPAEAVPFTAYRAPVDLCCCVDTSGSMTAEVSVKNEAGITETHGLSQLDLVKHAVHTIAQSLGPEDRLALVEFNSDANVVLPLTAMDDKGRAAALAALDPLKADGMTNLWGGVQASFELLRLSKARPNSAVFLLTDGVPTAEPPRGSLAMLQRYRSEQSAAMTAAAAEDGDHVMSDAQDVDDKDVKGPKPAAPRSYLPALYTFGFGYSLDSKLLDEMAVEGDGAYAFIPDASMVGTVFVNALSAVLTNAVVDVVTVVNAAPGTSLQLTPISDFKRSEQVRLGAVQVGSNRHLRGRIVVTQGDKSKVFDIDVMRPDIVVRFRTLDGRLQTVNVRATQAIGEQIEGQVGGGGGDGGAVADEADGLDESARQGLRVALVEIIRTTTKLMNEETADAESKAQVGLRKCIDMLQSSKLLQVKTDPYVKAILQDLQDQVMQALSRRDWFRKWGRHYLPSLSRAHWLQRCNNFKDPGVQCYAGRSFMAIRDQLDTVFCALPPPKPSAIKRDYDAHHASLSLPPLSLAGSPVLGGAAPAMAPPPPAYSYSMASYHSSHNPCFDGACTVLMADGSSKRIEDLRRGDRLHGDKTPPQVTCVIKTPTPTGGTVRLVQLPGGLRITPYHPVSLRDRGFVFPVELAPSLECADCPAVYSFVLDGGHQMRINGVDCVTWAHGFTDGAAAHPFFGTSAVLRDLERGDPKGFAAGYIILSGRGLQRDAETGLVTSLFH